MKFFLEQRFPQELAILRSLFGNNNVTLSLPRLNRIFEHTEAKWNEYSAELSGGRVKYLMIAEAPPWSSDGIPEYLLDPSSRSRSFMKALHPAFQLSSTNGTSALKELARRGFLLIDSIPFAMKYSSKRSSLKYDQLVQLTTKSYLQNKLIHSQLSFSDDLRIAFGVQNNALSILKALTQLNTGDHQYPLSSKMIAVSGAGYPDAGKLRELYKLV